MTSASRTDISTLAIHPHEKGFGGPAHTRGVTPTELRAARPGAADGWLGTPRVLLHEEALRHNLEAMASVCADRSAVLYPHGKTTMSPQLVARQLAAGAQGVTVATVQQARLFRHFGIRNVLIANEVTDPVSIAWLAAEVADATGDAVTMCYVDSVEGVDLLAHGLRDVGVGAGAGLGVLVELAHDGGRSGTPDTATALSVARAVAASPRLTLAGVAGYEGSIVAPTVSETLARATRFCEQLGTLTADLLAQGCFDRTPVVTAGGSAYFDAVLDALAGHPEWRLVLRSGCYLTHDNGLYDRVSPFTRSASLPTLRPALEVHAPVLSRPTPDRVVVGCGRRDISYDAGLPVLLRAWSPAGEDVPVTGAVAERLFDQHLVLSVPPDSPLVAGAEVALGVSHPCTTFDKWRWLPVVEDGRIVDVVRTFF
jgi:D-serine deaminase-like pyridoxal phosphate-dependent protein